MVGLIILHIYWLDFEHFGHHLWIGYYLSYELFEFVICVTCVLWVCFHAFMSAWVGRGLWLIARKLIAQSIPGLLRIAAFQPIPTG